MRQQVEAVRSEVGSRLVAVDGRVLPLKETRLRAEARGGLARVVLEQRFANPFEDPLSVGYLLPLPADGAVAGFAFRIGDRRIVGEVEGRKAARERYEQALIEGRSASLLEQDRSSVFTQELGNIPPRTEVVVEVTVDQRLAWLDEGSWEWRFPTTVSPRYQGAPDRVADAGRLAVDVADSPLPCRMSFSLVVRDALAEGRTPESPSHPLRFDARLGQTTVSLRDESGSPLDRDLVVRWPVARPEVGLSLATFQPPKGDRLAGSAFGLLSVVPPGRDGAFEPVPRDLIVLLDTSGSMDGAPLAQARRVASALVSSLSPADTLELIEFSSASRRWRERPAEATEAARRDALEWIRGLEAGGATEMVQGLYAALEPLRSEAQRQVVLVSDGQIGFEREIVETILAKLPEGSRLHVVGVGSSVNRSLTQPAARAGRGLEVIAGQDEDPERVVRRLLARTVAPVVTELTLSGPALVSFAPDRLPDLFAGAPVLIGVRLDPTGGALEVRGKTAEGPWTARLQVPPTPVGEGSREVASLFGRALVEDLEMRIAGGAEPRKLEKEIERAGLDFGLATRLTSWVAVSEEVDVDPRKPTRRVKMPHQLPDGVSAAGLGLRAMSSGATFFAGLAAPSLVAQEAPARLFRSVPMADSARSEPGLFQKAVKALSKRTHRQAPKLRPLRGRLVLRVGRKLVAELVVDGDGLRWQPATKVVVSFEDGTRVEGTVDVGETTAAGELSQGQVARLVLQLASKGPSCPPQQLELTLDGEPVVLTLR